MKIKIKEGGKCPFWIILPNWLAFRLLSFGLKKSQKYSCQVPQIPKNTLKEMKKAMKQSKSCHCHYELLTIESTDGDVVKILL